MEPFFDSLSRYPLLLPLAIMCSRVLLGFVIAPRKKVPELMEIISGVDPRSVVTIEDVRHSNIVEYRRRGGGVWGRIGILKKK